MEILAALGICLFLVGICMFGLGVHACYLCLTLMAHLKNFRHYRWQELTTLGKKTGQSNPSRGIPYIFTDLDEDDETIAELKRKLRPRLRQVGYMFAAFVFGLLLLEGLAVLLPNE
jgi:hypothetical protein